MHVNFAGFFRPRCLCFSLVYSFGPTFGPCGPIGPFKPPSPGRPYMSKNTLVLGPDRDF